jgi:hypothetical protein
LIAQKRGSESESNTKQPPCWRAFPNQNAFNGNMTSALFHGSLRIQKRHLEGGVFAMENFGSQQHLIGSEQADQADHNQINCNDVAQQAWDEQNQDARNQGN